MLRNSLMSQASMIPLAMMATDDTTARDQDKAGETDRARILATAHMIEDRAIAIGDKLAANEKFAAELGAFADRKEENAVSAIALALDIVTTLNPQEIMSAPEHNSEASHTDPETKKVVHNNNPDKFTTIDPDTGKKTPSSWYKVGALRTPVGKQTLADLHYVRMALKGEPSPVVDGKAQPNPYAGIGEKKLETLRDTLTTRISNLRRAYVDAFKVARQMALIDAINDNTALGTKSVVSVDIERDEDDADKVQKHNLSPIVIQDESTLAGAKRRHRYFSVVNFLALRPSKVTKEAIAAATAGGAWEVLVNSAAPRARKGDGAKDTSKDAAATARYPAVQSVDHFEEAAAAIVGYIDNATKEGKMHYAQIMAVAADDKTGDDMILTLGNLAMSMDGIWKVIERRYNVINEQRLARRENDKAA